MKTILALVFILTFSSICTAAHLDGGYGACISEDLFKEWVNAATNKDLRSRDYLLENGCLYPKPGTTISVIDTNRGIAKVRVFLKHKRTIILWTFIENIKP